MKKGRFSYPTDNAFGYFSRLYIFFCTLLHCLSHTVDCCTLLAVNPVFMLQFVHSSQASISFFGDLAELAAVKEYKEKRESLIHND